MAARLELQLEGEGHGGGGEWGGREQGLCGRPGSKEEKWSLPEMQPLPQARLERGVARMGWCMPTSPLHSPVPPTGPT